MRFLESKRRFRKDWIITLKFVAWKEFFARSLDFSGKNCLFKFVSESFRRTCTNSPFEVRKL